MTTMEIEANLQPHIRKNATGWTRLGWTYLAFLGVTLICEGMCLYAFRMNTPVLVLGIALTLLTVGFLAYGIHLFRGAAALQVADTPLVERLRRHLAFYGGRHEVLLWMVALSVVFLTLSASTLVDVEDGKYPIHRPWVFAAMTAVQLLFGYGSLKLGHRRMLRETRAILTDLEAQALGGTGRMVEERKAWRLWLTIAVVVLAGLAVLGAAVALGR